MEQEQQPEAGPNPMQRLQVILALDAQGGNIAEHLSETERANIADQVVRDYQTDRESMKDWLEKMQKGIDLAKLVKEDKNYPWKHAANVKYPLITTAALQFNARAYPAIVPSEEVVRAKVWGKDPQGTKAARADRVSAHMSWQLTCQMDEWEEETDKMLVMLPIIGKVIRKVWYDPVAGRPRCRVVNAGAFIVNDAVKTLNDAPRATEELPLFPSEIETRKRAGTFRNVDYVEEDGEDTQSVQTFLEQHCRIDLDGDGYDEPYIVTVHKENRHVARIVPDFQAEDVVAGPDGVVSIKRGSYFVPYDFLPAMDGGFWGTGLGILLGDISESINTSINMMLDADHMASLGGGFIGSEFRIKGGSNKMAPGEWRQVNARGADVKSALVPITFPGASSVMFQLLGLLIDAGKEVASVKDVLTGDTGGRAMTATTTLALIEQGMQVFTAAYKRIFRSLKLEYKLLARINAEHVSQQEYMAFHDAVDQNGQPVPLDPRQDYGAADMDIVPVADPRSVTKMQEAAKAELLMQMASQGLVNPQAASARALQAAAISDIEELMPQPDPMQQHMQQLSVKAAETSLTLQMVEIDKAIAEIDEIRSKTAKNMTDAAVTAQEPRFEEMRQRLELLRVTLSETLGRGPGRVEGAPGNASGQGGAGAVLQGPAPIGGSGMVGRQGMAGIGAPVALTG